MNDSNVEIFTHDGSESLAIDYGHYDKRARRLRSSMITGLFQGVAEIKIFSRKGEEMRCPDMSAGQGVSCAGTEHPRASVVAWYSSLARQKGLRKPLVDGGRAESESLCY